MDLVQDRTPCSRFIPILRFSWIMSNTPLSCHHSQASAGLREKPRKPENGRLRCTPCTSSHPALAMRARRTLSACPRQVSDGNNARDLDCSSHSHTTRGKALCARGALHGSSAKKNEAAQLKDLRNTTSSSVEGAACEGEQLPFHLNFKSLEAHECHDLCRVRVTAVV